MVAFKRHVGLFATASGGMIRVSEPGQSDIYGWIKTKKSTLPFEVEVKTGGAVQSKNQKNWQKICESFNVPHFVVREDGVEDLIKELSNVG